MTQLTPLKKDTFSEFVRAHRFVVIHYWAAWNGYDRVMDKLLAQQIQEDLRQLVAFASFDVDLLGHGEHCHQHEVGNVPFLEFYQDGLLVHSITGLREPEVIVEYLRTFCGAEK